MESSVSRIIPDGYEIDCQFGYSGVLRCGEKATIHLRFFDGPDEESFLLCFGHGAFARVMERTMATFLDQVEKEQVA